MSFDLAAAYAHARRHGYTLGVTPLVRTAEIRPEQSTGVLEPKLPKPRRISLPELEMGMMLESKKRAGEIVDYKPQGMSLAYSPDPETGIVLRYKCDFVVITVTGREWLHQGGGRKNIPVPIVGIRIIEVKGFGKHAISAAAKLRFRGAKAAWPMFQFEMWQRERDGNWRRVL